MKPFTVLLASLLGLGACLFQAQSHAQTPAPTAGDAPQGEVKGQGWSHSATSLQAAVAQADVVLPIYAGQAFSGKFKDLPTFAARRVPVVIFLHGSSGLGLKAIGEWQQWLALQGVASVAPDSFSLPDHVLYKSPIDKVSYERIHALRLSEIAPTLQAVLAQPWADTARLVLAGTSEGAVAVARYAGTEFAARMVYSWSCESNYFVQEPRNAFAPDRPVLNIISNADPYFSPANTWLGNPAAKGHCAEALKDNRRASVLLIPGAPHTLINYPAARDATVGFLRAALAP